MDLHQDPNDDLREHLEHIPWSDLTSHRQIPRWVPYVVAGALAVAALGVVAAGSLGGSRAFVPVQELTAPVTISVPSTTLPEAAPLYSEADLMALVPGTQEQLAAARAVWFVRDYFDSGGVPGETPEVVSSLPAGATIPGVDEQGTSYVEWVEPFSVEQLGDGLYRVGVVFGMLEGADVSTLTRLHPMAVAVAVAVDGGEAAVVDLPMPIESPSSGKIALWPLPEQDVPETIIDAAEQEALLWGEGPEVVAAGRGAAGWRVEVLVSDSAGVRWPMAVWVDEEGPIAAPPWDLES
jgi:hypothetical protein